MASHGSCSFFELTNEILKILNITKVFNINKISAKILSKMGIKTITTDNSIKIFGNPDLKINKKSMKSRFL